MLGPSCYIKCRQQSSINKFIIELENDVDYFKKQSKINTYSIYPHIITNINSEVTGYKESYYPSNFYNNFDQFLNQNNNNNQNPSFSLPINKDLINDKSDFTNTKIQTRIIPERNIIDIAVLSQKYSNE